jgi:hypothetical protein
MSVFKNFNTFESQYLQVRANIFNLFNALAFGQPGNGRASDNLKAAKSSIRARWARLFPTHASSNSPRSTTSSHALTSFATNRVPHMPLEQKSRHCKMRHNSKRSRSLKERLHRANLSVPRCLRFCFRRRVLKFRFFTLSYQKEHF